MIRQILVLDKSGGLGKHIDKVFGGFLRGYQIFRVSSIEDAKKIAKEEMIDVIAINGLDFVKALTADVMGFFKNQVYPPPKILLLLEPNLINMLPSVEGAVHAVVDSGNFRAVKFRRAVDKLIDDKYMEEKERRDKEVEERRNRSRRVWAEVDAICDDLEKKTREEY